MDTNELQNDLRRFFALENFDVGRVREISDVAVSPIQRAKLVERLDRYVRYGKGSSRFNAKKLIDRIGELA